MKLLIKKIQNLKKSKVGDIVRKRILEFEKVGSSSEKDVFSELCFCLLTANFQAEKCIKIQNEIGQGFENFSEKELALKLKNFGHRFWPQRAERIVLARECKNELCENVLKKNSFEIREWLVENVKGLGMKESSHFLRNIGYKNLAIIDFHILDLLFKEGLIEFDRKKKTLTKNKYLEIEKVLKNLSGKCSVNLAELDLYLWYLETGKVLK